VYMHYSRFERVDISIAGRNARTGKDEGNNTSERVSLPSIRLTNYTLIPLSLL
jgi:hypothetical protein